MENEKIAIPAIIAIVAIALFILYHPSQLETEITPNPLNTELYAALVSIGIENAVVDITPERAFVRYNLPENMRKVNYYIMGAAAAITNSSKIVIQVYENFTPLEEVVVNTDDVLAFMNETITYEEFEKRIEIKSLK